MVATKLMTIEELEALPPDGRKHELLWGELISVAPNFQHGRVVWKMMNRIGPVVEERALGVFLPEGSFLFARDPILLLLPDIAFVSTEREPPQDEQTGHITVIPNFVVEVISPSETSQTIRAKAHAYLDVGVSMVIVIDPRRRTVTLWDEHRATRVLSEADELSFGDIMPGISVTVGDLFS